MENEDIDFSSAKNAFIAANAQHNLLTFLANLPTPQHQQELQESLASAEAACALEASSLQAERGAVMALCKELSALQETSRTASASASKIMEREGLLLSAQSLELKAMQDRRKELAVQEAGLSRDTLPELRARVAALEAEEQALRTSLALAKRQAEASAAAAATVQVSSTSNEGAAAQSSQAAQAASYYKTMATLLETATR
jgi:hypothetical protein